MATLTKGMSFRRQGSSGLIWAENFTFTEDGTLVRGRPPKDENSMQAPVRLNEPTDTKPASPVMRRSKSVGSTFEGTAARPSTHKSGFRLVRWLKKAFTRRRR